MNKCTRISLLCFACAVLLNKPAIASEIRQLENNKVIFSFSLESFHGAWRLMNQVLSAPFEYLVFSDPRFVPSRGRFVSTNITDNITLVFQLDPVTDHITTLLLTSKSVYNAYDQLVLRNVIAMLVSLVDHEMQESVFAQIIQPILNHAAYIHQMHHGVTYISFINSRGQFILIVNPAQLPILQYHTDHSQQDTDVKIVTNQIDDEAYSLEQAN